MTEDVKVNVCSWNEKHQPKEVKEEKVRKQKRKKRSKVFSQFLPQNFPTKGKHKAIINLSQTQSCTGETARKGRTERESKLWSVDEGNCLYHLVRHTNFSPLILQLPLPSLDPQIAHFESSN